jgi:hypothetical protein
MTGADSRKAQRWGNPSRRRLRFRDFGLAVESGSRKRKRRSARITDALHARILQTHDA